MDSMTDSLRFPRRFQCAATLPSLITTFLAVMAATQSASANIINFDTSLNSPWTVTGGGAVAAPAFYLAPPEISITSNASSSGSFAAGGSFAQFAGAWYADFQFQLPANATNVSMSFSNLIGDDRVVLQLNGTDLGDYFLNGNSFNPPLTGSGAMRFPSQSSDQPYTFTGITSGNITTGFNIGTTNDIRLVVNNTNNANLFANTVTFQNSGDTTDVGIVGTVTYSLGSIPEPTPFLVYVCPLIASLIVRKRSSNLLTK
jgi:hypothetical protein